MTGCSSVSPGVAIDVGPDAVADAGDLPGPGADSAEAGDVAADPVAEAGDAVPLDPGDVPGEIGVSATQACADEAHAVCLQRSACSNGFGISKNYPDETTCETRTAAACVVALGATGTALTPALIEACVAALPGESCADLYDLDPVAACLPPAGTFQADAGCGVAAQCATTFCAVASNQPCGTCQPLPAPGASCQVPGDCGRDLACTTAGQCATYAANGASCLTGVQPCAAGLWCVGDVPATTTTGTCQAAGATVGAACDGSHKTLPGCDNALGLVCVPSAAGATVGTCAAIVLKAPGAVCGFVGASPITGFADCQAGGLCVKGLCVAPAADGAACDSDATIGPPCLAPAKCVPSTSGATAGTCTVPDAKCTSST
jgi:hypothetical protein